MGTKVSKEWKENIVNYNAQLGKNSTLFNTRSPDIPVTLLTSGCNTTIENLSRFIESICVPLTSNLPNIIKDTTRLSDLIDDISKGSLPDSSFVNVFPNIDNEKEMEAVHSLLDPRSSKNPTTQYITEGPEISFLNSFAYTNPLQTNCTATEAPNSCSYYSN